MILIILFQKNIFLEKFKKIIIAMHMQQSLNIKNFSITILQNKFLQKKDQLLFYLFQTEKPQLFFLLGMKKTLILKIILKNIIQGIQLQRLIKF